MAAARPSSIRRFEALQIAALLLVLAQPWVARAPSNDALVEVTIVFIMELVLTLLISRRRKLWARWWLVGSFMAGVGITVLVASSLLETGWLAVAMTALITGLQAVALVLVFTRQATNWLRTPPSLAETFA